MAIGQRDRLLAALAGRISDYRTDELPAPTSDHVDRWVRQFPAESQEPLLAEMIHVFERAYFRRERVEAFLQRLARNPGVAAIDPRAFWHGARFLDIQQNGDSQREMLAMMRGILRREYHLDELGQRPLGGDFIYLDDVLFTGGRAGSDLEAWIAADAPPDASLRIVTIATHDFGEYKLKERLQAASAHAGKRITVCVDRDICFENRLKYRPVSEVLWPAALPEDQALQDYLVHRHYGMIHMRA